MAGLNLAPNPAVLVTQAGLFLASMHFVKKLMIDPYLEVRTKRLGRTLGDRDEAKKMTLENEKLRAQIEERLAQSIHRAKAEADGLRKKANLEKNALLKSAQDDAQSFLKKMDLELEASLKAERSKIPEVVDQIAEISFQYAIN